jgi:hypothetical protein
MKARALVYCILLLTLVLSLLSTVILSSESIKVNSEVNASDISKHIEDGDDVNLVSYSIVGDLNVNKSTFAPISNPDFNILLNKH